MSQYLAEWIRAIKRNPSQVFRPYRRFTCTLCQFFGRFVDIRDRREARCPNCGSRERDRTIALFWTREDWDFDHRSILHFSPEKSIWPILKDLPGYVSSDIKTHKRAAQIVDIQDIGFPDQFFDDVICNHVLEHVPEHMAAMSECFRVMKPGGRGIFSVPIDTERAETWHPPAGTPTDEIERICGPMHLRLYGLDFPDLLRSVGFEVERIAVTDDEDAKHRLISVLSDTVYVARRPKGAS